MLRELAAFLHHRTIDDWRARRRLPTVRFGASVRWLGDGTIIAARDVAVGAGSVIVVAAGCTLELGHRVWLGRDCEIGAGTRLRIGERTSLQHRTQLHGDVQIGAGCIGAANLYVSSNDHAFRDTPWLPLRVQDRHRRDHSREQDSRPVSIGDDCWFGINVVVMPGVTVGRGCVVGANSVVTRDLEPYAIAAGAPARRIGSRLEFEPRREVSAAVDEHIPYFYSGFRQLGDDETPLRHGDGFSVDRTFVLALDAQSGNGVALDVHATRPCSLRHGAIARPIPSGRSTVCFVAEPERTGRLAFHLDPFEPEALAVTSARVVAPP